jgi:anti-sigma-K factor RskA
MNPGNDHNELYELYVLGLLEDPERSRIEADLKAGLPEAQSRLKKALEINALLSTVAPAAEPPKRLRGRILAIARPEQPRWASNLAWAGLSFCLLAALVYTSFDRQSTASDLAEARRALTETRSTLELREAALDFLRRPETRLLRTGAVEESRPVAKFFVNPNQGVLLVASNLPRLETGRTFEMWIVPKVGSPRPAGVFKASPDGAAVHLQAGSVNVAEAAAMALSVEPEGGSPQPTTQPFVIHPIGE